MITHWHRDFRKVFPNAVLHERKIIDEAIKKAAEATDSFIKDGIDYCMNNYNTKTPAQD